VRKSSWLAGVLLIGGIARYLYSAVLGSGAAGVWITLADQLRPLIARTWHGVPFDETIPLLPDALRYGPTFYLVAGPIIAATRSLDTVHHALTIFGHVCFWLTLWLIDRRLFRNEHWSIRAIFAGVALNFTPQLETLRCACLDTWELLSMTAGFFVFTSTLRWRRELAAAPIVAGILTKLVPILTLLFVIVRRWTAVFVAAATTLVILALGQIFFGWTMGFGFPQRALNVMLLFGAKKYPFWWENDSPRGLLLKALSGFHLRPGVWYIDVAPDARRIVQIVMTAAALALLAWVMLRLWRWSASGDDDTLLVAGGFASAIVLHHLISPYSTHQYLGGTLLPYAFVLAFLVRRSVRRIDLILAALSLILIGNIAPKSIIIRILCVAKLNALRHSAPQLEAGQLYTFYGFPGVGLILLAIVVFRFQRTLTRGSLSVSADEKEWNSEAHP
jgi:hypothetical protein